MRNNQRHDISAHRCEVFRTETFRNRITKKPGPIQTMTCWSRRATQPGPWHVGTDLRNDLGHGLWDRIAKSFEPGEVDAEMREKLSHDMLEQNNVMLLLSLPAQPTSQVLETGHTRAWMADV